MNDPLLSCFDCYIFAGYYLFAVVVSIVVLHITLVSLSCTTTVQTFVICAGRSPYIFVLLQFDDYFYDLRHMILKCKLLSRLSLTRFPHH